MRIQNVHDTIEDVAHRLAREGREAEPGIQRTFLFPSNEQIRLIHVDPTTSPVRPGESIAPFYFGADAASGIPYPSAIALIRPEDVLRVSPPDGWGDWNEAEVI